MAECRYSRHPSSLDRKNAEVALLNWLTKSKLLIPKKRNDFMAFIYKHFDCKDFPEFVVHSVWVQLKSLEKKIKECPTIVLSSDDEKPQVTEVLDFDTMDSENEPNITLLQLPRPSPKSPEKRRREHHRTPGKVKATLTTEDQAMLKKFRQQIILEELLKRDKEMLMIQQKQEKDKFQAAVQIELGYTKRIQKERVDALAAEMLRLHKEGYRDGLSPDSLTKLVCLVDPPHVIPSENVIAERLPSPDPYTEELVSQEMTDDQINYDMLYPASRPDTSLTTSRRTKTGRGSRSDPSGTKRFKKKKRSVDSRSSSDESYHRRSKREIEADLLRQKLYIDTLIEMALPEVIEEIEANNRLRYENDNYNNMC